MIVGLSFGGKASSYRISAKALVLVEGRGEEIFVYSVWSCSHKWSNGVIAVSHRQFATSTKKGNG